MMTKDGYVITDDMIDEDKAKEYEAYHWTYKED